MASAVDICNLALSHLGDGATVSSIDPPEGSAQAEHCKRFYPIARDNCLERHPWNFSTKRVTLAELSGAAPASWVFAYAWPNAALGIFDVYSAGAGNDDTDGEEFVVETLPSGDKVIYTNAEQASARISVSISDTTKFSPLFVAAVSRLLASYLAGPIIKAGEGRAEAREQYKWFLQELGTAAMHDSRSRKKDTYKNFEASSIAARR